jgi:hypothetical protein
VVGIFIASDHNEIADFEIGKLGGLTIFAVLGFVREVDSYSGAIEFDDLKRVSMDGRNLSGCSVTLPWTAVSRATIRARRRGLRLLLGSRGRIRSLCGAGGDVG